MLLKQDGFDNYTNLSLYWPYTPGGVMTPVGGGVFSYGRAISGNPRLEDRFASTDELIVACHWETLSSYSITGRNCMWSFFDILTNWRCAGVSLNPSFQFTYYRDDGLDPVIMKTSDRQVIPGLWYWVCIHYKRAQVGGFLRVYVNEELWLDFTGDTVGTQTATTSFDSVILTRANDGPITQNVAYDNLFICDATGPAPWNAPLSERRLYYSLPISNGVPTDWTPNGAASNYQCVNSNPQDNAKYISSDTPGQIDVYGFAPIEISGTPIIDWVAQVITGYKDDATPRYITAVEKRGLSTAYSPDVITLNPVNFMWYNIMYADPLTGVAWQYGDLATTNYGVRLYA